MVCFPLPYLVFASFIFDLDSRGILSLVLSPLFYLTSFAWIVTGIGLRRMQKWSWYSLSAAQVFNTYLNALNLLNYSKSDQKGIAFGLTFLIQIYVYLAVRKELQVPYLFPKIRWWESGIAGMNHIQTDIMHLNSPSGVSTGAILDINLKGCFIKTHLDFEPFEKITIRIESHGHKLDIAGLVVWNAASTVTHPKGIGMKFLKMDRTRRRKLKVISSRFVKKKVVTHEFKKIPA